MLYRVFDLERDSITDCKPPPLAAGGGTKAGQEVGGRGGGGEAKDIGSLTGQGALGGWWEGKRKATVAAVEDVADQCVLDYFKNSERNKQPGHKVALKVACDDILFSVQWDGAQNRREPPREGWESVVVDAFWRAVEKGWLRVEEDGSNKWFLVTLEGRDRLLGGRGGAGDGLTNQDEDTVAPKK